MCSGTILDFGSTLVFPASGGCPSSFQVEDPKLETPALHGGSTKTFALGGGSAAIDFVPTAGCPAFDQRGFSRPAGPACDAGAFEDQLPSRPGRPMRSSGASPNQGMFSLAWSASTDPDGPAPMYRLFHQDASIPKFFLVTTTTGPSYTFSVPETEGTFRYAVSADDGNHLSLLSSASDPVVVDRTGPSTPAATADRQPDAVGWYRDTVTVSFSGSSDPALQDGSPGSGVAAITAPETRNTSGVFDVVGKATDAAGNDSAEATLTVKVDAEAPTVGFTNCPADVLLRSTVSATWSASDPSSGLLTASSGAIPLNTATIGSRSVTASATDNVGHTASATCAYRVIFDFNGFFSPIMNAPTLQSFKAGDGIPVSFSLDGDQGLGVIAAGYPQSSQIDCGASPELGAGLSTTSQKGLEFKRAQGRYKYLWSTQAGWAGTCRQLIVKLIDGTVHRANFRFT